MYYIQELDRARNSLSFENTTTLHESIIKCEGIIYLIGNGGSSSIASHICNDIIKQLHKQAICLTDNVSTLTAYSNDIEYHRAFTRQLEVFLKPNDLVIGLSTSGKSTNILSAIKYASSICNTIALFGNGNASYIKGLNLNTNIIYIESSSTPIVEDCFQILLHSAIWYDYEK